MSKYAQTRTATDELLLGCFAWQGLPVNAERRAAAYVANHPVIRPVKGKKRLEDNYRLGLK